MISTRKAALLSGAAALAFVIWLVIWTSASAQRPGPEREIVALPAASEAILTGGNDPDQPPLELLPGALIDINTASAEELTLLPGIGEALANAIVTYRMENGAFKSLEQLMEVPGIGAGRFDAVKDKICLGEGLP